MQIVEKKMCTKHIPKLNALLLPRVVFPQCVLHKITLARKFIHDSYCLKNSFLCVKPRKNLINEIANNYDNDYDDTMMM